MLTDYFYNPERSFEYVSDSVLWDKIFMNPFPKDINDSSKGMIRLWSYFIVTPALILNPNGPKKERKLIQPRELFLKTKKDDRNEAFVSLCGFLNHFGRPFRDCIVDIPKHKSMEKNPELSPVAIYFKEPKYPVIDKSDNMIRIEFQREIYPKIYKYCFGKEPDVQDNNQTIRFSFICFRGFVLQY